MRLSLTRLLNALAVTLGLVLASAVPVLAASNAQKDPTAIAVVNAAIISGFLLSNHKGLLCCTSTVMVSSLVSTSVSLLNQSLPRCVV